MCPSTQQSPNEFPGGRPPRNGSSNVRGSVSYTDGKDWRILRSAIDGWGKAEDATAVGRGAFGEEGDAAVGIFGKEALEGDEFRTWWGVGERRSERTDDSGEESQALNLSNAGI